MKAKMQEEKQPVVEQAVKKVGGGGGELGTSCWERKEKGKCLQKR